MPSRNCLDCGAGLPIQHGRHQPRKYCETCRPPRNRGKEQADAPQRVTEIRPGAQTEGLSLYDATRARLQSAGRLAAPESVLVLSLAKSVDDGGHSGASLASLSNAFSRALSIALADVEETASDDVEWGVG